MSKSELEDQLCTPPAPGGFGPEEIAGLDEPVKRYFNASIDPGVPLATSARISMRGKIKVKRWLPFRARQVLSPHHGFVWAGRAGGVIVGGDSLVERVGLLDWKLFGRVTVAHAEGPDVAQSAAGRAAAEAIWLPTALLPRFGVTWSSEGSGEIAAALEVAGVPVEVHLKVNESGLPASVWFQRWGDPSNSGKFDWHPFGGEITGYAGFDGLTIPSKGRLGWFYGTDRWNEGEFFRYEIVGLNLVC
jgi:hypothetical protein